MRQHRYYSNAAASNAEAEGFNFTGHWESRWNRAELKAPAARYRKQGFLVKVLRKDDGVAIYIKDTPKTLAAAEAVRIADEEHRKLLVAEISQYLLQMAGKIDHLPARTLKGIRNELDRLVESTPAA
jgi:prophage DNA circulation protein